MTEHETNSRDALLSKKVTSLNEQKYQTTTSRVYKLVQELVAWLNASRCRTPTTSRVYKVVQELVAWLNASRCRTHNPIWCRCWHKMAATNCSKTALLCQPRETPPCFTSPLSSFSAPSAVSFGATSNHQTLEAAASCLTKFDDQTLTVTCTEKLEDMDEAAAVEARENVFARWSWI